MLLERIAHRIIVYSVSLSLTGVHTKNGYDVNKKLNSQNSKEHWLYL